MTEQNKTLAILQRMEAKLDNVDHKIDVVHKDAIKQARVAGATAGALSGAIVVAGIEFIKIKLGM